MSAQQLATRAVVKPWGRRVPGLGFDDPAPGGQPVGEIWFEAPGTSGPEADLLVKYLFTSEKLSVQVHPGDAAAQARGHARGKEECWLVLDAEPGARIGIGLVAATAPERLRAAALDGSVEALLDWKDVAAGDFFYLPAGTIHAIGAGVTLLEVQQNSDITYRLFDYGRPRELHLEEAVAVADAAPWQPLAAPGMVDEGREILAAGRALVLERFAEGASGTLAPDPGRPVWIVPLSGEGSIDGAPLAPGTVWLADGETALDFAGDLVIAYPGARPLAASIVPPGP
ncbi:class I mannose-6-phosphate isomerase [Parasphingopyxis marina]|uniref:Class I mannose-6-phosphate isomerase n=1 Tax=Parasphingopyxis marina TaxID=2761622 RepID=A0A842HTV7_9SPHN|nr:class I mannose-6-phosphate isomerase [Parasphingopyxis marina]MBC2776516.1 class I mannose-6-phosphate isomerase [Parasphingopyxis marina]